MDTKIKKDSDEYKERFVDYLMKGFGMDRDIAEAEFEATLENVTEEFSCPESDADEALSYWTAD